jgi:predicted nucleic acid-binding protein
MPEAIFIDTWGWLALGHRRDTRHQKIKAFYGALQEGKFGGQVFIFGVFRSLLGLSG